MTQPPLYQSTDTVCQKLPADFQVKVDSVREFIEKQVTEHNELPDHIINMDEPPLTSQRDFVKYISK